MTKPKNHLTIIKPKDKVEDMPKPTVSRLDRLRILHGDKYVEVLLRDHFEWLKDNIKPTLEKFKKYTSKK